MVEGGGSKPGRQIEWLETYFDIHLDNLRKSDLVSATEFECELPYNLMSDPDFSEQGGSQPVLVLEDAISWRWYTVSQL